MDALLMSQYIEKKNILTLKLRQIRFKPMELEMW